MKAQGLLVCFAFNLVLHGQEPVAVSGVYPHLRMWNNQGECGTGAVVPWQGSLWAITYAPHAPGGSDDKLYEITPDLQQHIYEGSVGGTPANRMIHRESKQLLIGPYWIDEQKKIRVLPPTKMPGRLTGNARHLTDPANLVYYATMEEGLYEVDVHTLEVRCLILDEHTRNREGLHSQLPGYHGKGFYTGQGRLIYTNNGEKGADALRDPTTLSGALAEWRGQGDWQLVRRNQFTEATGPGGIFGNDKPDSDPVWTMGWDAKSLLLGLLQDGTWSFYRLPKGSHSYDGAHGWNTEWPRIREIGEKDLLATMHGTFWRFPTTFSRENSAGIAPRSNYLKVIGDFCRWNDRIVFGCDDSAKNEFLNTRPFKAKHGAPKQSNSNLWFVEPSQLDSLGPAIGRGSVWLREDLGTAQASDPFLFSGYDYRHLQITHHTESPVTFRLEVDRRGNQQWDRLREITLDSKSCGSFIFDSTETGAWIRLVSTSSAKGVTAHFHYRNRDLRSTANDAMFAGIAASSERFSGLATYSPSQEMADSRGVIQSLAYDKLGLVAGLDYYEMSSDLKLKRIEDPNHTAQVLPLLARASQPANTYFEDEASLLLIEDGKRYRLPKNPSYSYSQPSEKFGKSLRDYLPESITRGAKVDVGGVHGNYRPEYAVDGIIGDDDLRYVSEEGQPGWIEIDLGEPKPVQEIWVVTGWKGEEAYRATDFLVETLIDGNWVRQAEVVDNPDIEYRLQLEKPVSIEKIKIKNQLGAFFRVYEVAAFSEGLEIADEPVISISRVCREVATERDLLNLHGTFYELPARNAQGLAKIRPVATHDLHISDFCSHNGLLFLSGVRSDAQGDRIFRSDDGRTALWAGVIDDLWKLGKPRGQGGPWKRSLVAAEVPSDPYLMTGYDRKKYAISLQQTGSVTLEVDIDGTNLWVPYGTFSVEAGTTVSGTFPEGYSAYWVRAVSDRANEATVLFTWD